MKETYAGSHDYDDHDGDHHHHHHHILNKYCILSSESDSRSLPVQCSAKYMSELYAFNYCVLIFQIKVYRVLNHFILNKKPHLVRWVA